MDPYAIQPIPRRCPIPRGLPAHIGGIIQEKPIYVLRKGDKEIVIQAGNDINEHPLANIDASDPDFMLKSICALERMYREILGIIQMILPDNDLFDGPSNLGYLRKDAKSGRFWISLRYKKPRYYICPMWGSRIREEEIDFRVWGKCGDRRGFWKGQPVDVIYAWNQKEMIALNKATNGWKAVEGLDVTFEVYGHLTDADGCIIGLVSESATPGRMITKEDKLLVFDAISRVEKAGCLYRSCLQNRFMIIGNKVRLMELSGIERYSNEDRVTLEHEAKRWHWHFLDRLFKELENHGSYGLPLPRFTATENSITILCTLPGRPDLPSARIRLYPLRVGSQPETPDEDQPLGRVVLSRRRPRFTSSSIVISREDHGSGLGTLRVADSRHGRALRASVSLAHWPYHYQRRLMASERFSTTEDTNSTTFFHPHD